MSQTPAAAVIWNLLSALRQQQPLVHNITNFVVMNNTANALLALGASPAMIHSSDEVEDFVTLSQALVINIGTLSSEQLAACKLAVHQARAARIPWILDPVGAGVTPYRRRAASALARLGPAVIRGNGSEILTLAQHAAENREDSVDSQGKGVDSQHGSERAVEAAQWLARDTGAVVAVTGAVDYITDGTHLAAVHNGHSMMSRVTGLGCSATAVIGAFLAVEPNAFTATVAGLAVFGIAGEIAAAQSPGPGSLQVALLDALYLLDEPRLCSKINVTDARP